MVFIAFIVVRFRVPLPCFLGVCSNWLRRWGDGCDGSRVVACFSLAARHALEFDFLVVLVSCFILLQMLVILALSLIVLVVVAAGGGDHMG